MEVSQVEGLDAPAIMRIGAARLTAGLDRMPRLDLDAHREIFGPLPRLSIEELISMAEQVDLRGQGGAAFPFARKLRAVVQSAQASDSPTIVAVSAVTVVWLSCSLMSKPASLPVGNVNWPIELWVVAVNSDVMGSVDPLLCAE